MIRSLLQKGLIFSAIFFSAFFFVTSCSKKDKYVSITCTLYRPLEGVVDLYFMNPDSEKPVKIDSLVANKDSILTFSKVPTRSVVVVVSPQFGVEIPLFVEDQNLTATQVGVINIQGQEIPDWDFTGSESQLVVKKFQEKFRDKYRDRMMVLYQSLSQAKSSGADQNEVEKLIKDIEELNNRLQQEKLDFITSHASYDTAPYMLISMISPQMSDDDLDKIQKIYQSFTPERKASFFGNMVSRSLKASSLTKTGITLENFTLPNTEGEEVSLSSFKGKTLLIDFWASWCQPCRVGHPELKSLYAQFKDKGFEIVSISLDEDISKWEEAVKVDQLSWSNLRDDIRDKKSSLAVKYSIAAIPYNLLLSPQGEILAKNVFGQDLKEKLEMALKK